jgi:hypothetical protein
MPDNLCIYKPAKLRLRIDIPATVDILAEMYVGRVSQEQAFNELVDRVLSEHDDLPRGLQRNRKFRAWVFAQVKRLSSEILIEQGILHQLH